MMRAHDDATVEIVEVAPRDGFQSIAEPLPTALKSVEQAGGTISYEPVAAGTGAVFVVKLIVAQLEEQPPEPETETTQREPSFA